MATYTKLPLSSSDYGRQILITATSGSIPTAIHTAPAGTTHLDEVWLYAYNDHTSSNIPLTICWGGTSEPSDITRTTILYRSGRTLVADGRILQNGLTVSAYAASGSFITIDGFVNRVTL